MNNRDDDQFEAYLRKFQPLAPGPLPSNAIGRRYRFFAWAGAAAAITLALGLHLGFKLGRSRQPMTEVVSSSPISNSQPLTIRDANELLLHSSSTKAALDRVAFQSQVSDVPKGQQSVLAALSEEEKP